MAAERQAPGGPFVVESGTRQAQAPGGAYVLETVSAVGATYFFNPISGRGGTMAQPLVNH